MLEFNPDPSMKLIDSQTTASEVRAQLLGGSCTTKDEVGSEWQHLWSGATLFAMKRLRSHKRRATATIPAPEEGSAATSAAAATGAFATGTDGDGGLTAPVQRGL